MFFTECGFSVLLLELERRSVNVDETFREGREDAGKSFDESNFEFIGDFCGLKEVFDGGYQGTIFLDLP